MTGVSSQHEEGVHQEGSTKFNVETLVREAYEALKAKIEDEERWDTWSNLERPEDKMHVGSSGTKDGGLCGGQRTLPRYHERGSGASHRLVLRRNDDRGWGRELWNNEGHFRSGQMFKGRWSGTSNKGDALHDRGRRSIQRDVKGDNDVKVEVPMDESTMINGAKTFPTLVRETLAVAPVCQCETREMEGVGGKADDQKGDEDDKVNDHEHRDPFEGVSAHAEACIQKCITTSRLCAQQTTQIYITQRKRGETRLKLRWKSLVTILCNSRVSMYKKITTQTLSHIMLDFSLYT